MSLALPRATYRLQLRQEFSFASAEAIVPYLRDLGISHIYASPITTARRGSAHGYDVIDPTAVNPELGGEDGLQKLVRALRANDMGLIIDIVPNHMAASEDNAWWMDVLAHGEASQHAKTFDIDWRPVDPALNGKIALPVLGDPYGEVLAKGDLKTVYDEALGRWFICYFDNRFPVRPEDQAELDTRREALSAEKLHALLERQNWRLAWWRTAGDEINWRRFFEINDLVGVRVEDPDVFEMTHAWVLRLYQEGLIDGVRIDHIDGLADPGAYLRRLRARLDELETSRPKDAAQGPAYIIVEKILATDEQLPVDWPVDGATGYEFMDQVGGLLHNGAAKGALTDLWTEKAAEVIDYETQERAARAEILDASFAGQLDATARSFHRLARLDLHTRDISLQAIRRSLIAVLVRLRCYRTYAAPDHPRPLSESAEQAFNEALAHAGPDEHAVRFLLWLISGAPETATEAWPEAIVRFQQLSAPLAAKSVEDTLFYRYGRLVSRNEVGSSPKVFAVSTQTFHRHCGLRAEQTPHTLLASATHDHKRGEDVRARLACLTEDPDRWRDFSREWLEAARALAPTVHASDVYQLLQTMVGAWPLGLDAWDEAALKEYSKRVEAWQEKALREQKLRSSWTQPNEAYETACAQLARNWLNPKVSAAFLAALVQYVETIASRAAAKGLVQAFLRCATPGVPDCYQGCEFWDFSLVDPDNRRPVDYDARRASLSENPDFSGLAASWRDGRVKQAVIRQVLKARAKMPDVFQEGDYEPIEVHGPNAEDFLAFRRRRGDLSMLGAAWLGRPAPLAPDQLVPSVSDLRGLSVQHPDVDGTRIPLPALFSENLPVTLYSYRTDAPDHWRGHLGPDLDLEAHRAV